MLMTLCVVFLAHDRHKYRLLVRPSFLASCPPSLPSFSRCSIGPVAQFHENSKYYSAVPPAPNKLVDENLPHMTIEMPVYKESLSETM